MERCKTCGKEFTANQVMTYSVYGYCSWDCLMNKKSRYNNSGTHNNQNYNRQGRRQNTNRQEGGSRSKWVQNY